MAKRKEQRFSRVIVESPYSGDVARNEIYLQRVLRDCIARGETPYASHQMLTRALNDLDPAERATGMRAGRDWYEAASKCVVYTDYGMSGGMQIGVDHARDIGLEVEMRTIGPNPEGPVIDPPPRRTPGVKGKRGETRKKIVALRTQGLTQTQISTVLDCTESNVRYHLLNDAIEQEGGR